MNSGRFSGAFRRTWIFIAIFVVCAFLIKPTQDFIEARTSQNGPEPDLLFFSSPKLVKHMALGYDGLLADIYWMRAIQYYGRREEAAKREVRYKNLSTLLDITTTLDPYILDIYRSGSSFLAEPEPIGAGQPKEAIKLIDKGIQYIPQDWRLIFDKGFVYYIYLNDFKSAGDVWLSATKLPGAPPWLKSLAAASYSKGGAMEIAIYLWQRQYKESTRADIKENARNYLVSIQVAKDLWSLEILLDKYHAKKGFFPSNLNELLRNRTHTYNLADPLGTSYQYDSSTGSVQLSPESNVRYLKIPENYRQELQKTNDELRIDTD
jgi:tetratricopeptide (TPR) repeat protein